MSYEITIKCDGLDCCRERSVDELHRLPTAWGEHDSFHYCDKCWPQVQQEIKDA
jgi:hypothetical protein